jgi:glyoxylase-like metal-dependent hydrolase (beta-lactamase superfamily II)
VRRPRLAWSLALAAGLAAGCAGAGAPPRGVTLTPLADGVWLHASHRDVPGFGLVLSQGLVVRSGEGVLVVDTAWTDADTRVLLEEVRTRLGHVLGVVVTHAHDDKMGGMGAVREAGIRSYAHPFTNLDAPARGLMTASDTLFADGRSVQSLAGVEVFHPGAGHTRDNLVVYVAWARVLFGGCLVRPGDATDLGNTADADVSHWADAARAVAARYPDARVVVPSHGAAGGRELLEHTIALAEAAAPR